MGIFKNNPLIRYYLRSYLLWGGIGRGALRLS